MFSILVVEGEGVITQLVREQFGGEGYQAVVVRNGEDAVQFAMREMPGLIILDVELRGIDGYQVIQQLRDHPKCMHIPIIMVSAHSSLVDKVRAYELGVDSYITKPCCSDELLAHIRRQLRRVQQTTLSPLTRLPGGLQLERAIDYKLRGSDPWSVLYLDLDNFKAFNDAYGFVTGNDMILLVGHICQRVVYEYGNADDFVGHVGGDDFVIVTTPDREKILCRHILARYKQESMSFYHPEDIERGSINGVDRSGHPYQFPLVSLSIGVVSDQLRCSHSMNEVSTLTAEAKRLAKQSSNNVSRVSPQWGVPTQVSHTPASFNLVGNVGRNLFHFSEEDVLAKFK
ncbi:diguanylate cyclase response regulator [Dictyobacter sp. S3.2.2.5]|uniref:Diguanylate cyclase response regulator n=1 Tax=Dictyobacter halimunensis TaxID=3026934 RepID=A0ABQ6G2X6_9CHLR|nr:diguanylate cyclase response regulator [Dictyobacter sp. S3.2.2.5]